MKLWIANSEEWVVCEDVSARVFADMSNANCTQQSLNNIQTYIQEIDNFTTQKVNTNLYDSRR